MLDQRAKTSPFSRTYSAFRRDFAASAGRSGVIDMQRTALHAMAGRKQAD
jgi:hypothetical protein